MFLWTDDSESDQNKEIKLDNKLILSLVSYYPQCNEPKQ